jgi:tape measure domain-containing protein
VAYDFTVKGDTSLDTSGIDKGLNKIKSLSGIAFTALSAGFAAATKAGLKYYSELEGYETSFEVMLGSQEKAINLMEELKTKAAKTPFELADLASTTQLLLNYGITQDEVINQMEMLGDISQGSSEKMTRIATAYGQMSSAGKVQLEDVKQMIEAGFNPLQEISESTGETMASLYDRISKGTISVDEITASMERSTSVGGKYFGSMDKQSETLSGKLSTLKDTVMNKLSDSVSEFADVLKDDVIPEITKFVEEVDMSKVIDVLKGAFKGLIGVLKFVINNIDTLLPLLGTMFVLLEGYTLIKKMQEAYSGLHPIIQIVSAKMSALNGVMLANPMGAVVATIGVLVGALALLDTATTTYQESQKKLGEDMSTMAGYMNNFASGVENAESIFSDFNDELILSGEKQSELESQIQNLQGEIYTISKNASDARRELTQAEIDRIEELFGELEKLSGQTLEALQYQADMAKSTATSLSESYEGSADGYLEEAQKIIKGSQEIKDEIIANATETYNGEIATLGLRTEANAEWYDQQLLDAQTRRDNTIKTAKQEYADVNAIISEGYLERSETLNTYLADSAEHYAELERLGTEYTEKLKAISSDETLTELEKGTQISELQSQFERDRQTHVDALSQLNDEEAMAALGNYTAMVSNAKLYGATDGLLTKENENLVTNFLSAYDGLPEATKSAFDQAMEGAIESLAGDKVNTLLEKGKGVVKSFLSLFTGSDGFDEHSPSKKFEQIFDYVFDGAENSIDENENSLLLKGKKVAQGFIGAFDLSSQIGTSLIASRTSSTSAISSTSTQIVNINQPVKTPVETARAIRMENLYGMAGAQ